VIAAPPHGDPDGMDTTLTPDPAWRVALRPLITARGWTSLTHNLLGLPLGTAYFIWLVTGLSTGLGLAITIIGIPLLTLVLAATRPLLMLERGLANALLGTELPPVAVAPQAEGWFGRLKAYWTDGTTWRGVGYLFARFPIGIATFTIAVTTYGVALWCLAAPLLAPLEAMDLGFWEPNSVLEGLAFVPFGVVALFTAGWITEGMAAMSRGLIKATIH
jgi:Putative sensor